MVAYFIPILIAIVAGLLIEGFFQLIKYRDDLNKKSPQPIYKNYYLDSYYFPLYQPLYQPGAYMSVVDFLSGGKRRWGAYLLFRFFPPLAILLLLAAIIERYFQVDATLLMLLIGATVSLALRDGWMVWGAKYTSSRIIHLCNIIATYGLCLLIGMAAQLFDITFIAPSVSGLFDNMWSTLLVATVVLLYSRIMYPQPKELDIQAEQTALDNYVFESYKTIGTKYGNVIDRAALQYSCSKPILYAVLIYENMNRPHWMRVVENTITKVTRAELTLGIAQVKSNKVISDEESILKAARILKNSNSADAGYGSGFVDIQQLEGILENYNSSALYAESVAEIMAALRKYTTDVFPFSYGAFPTGYQA